MEISFLGTGAAEGFPAEFCSCKNCIAARAAGESEYRTRSQVLIDGVLSVDFPPEAYAHSLKFNKDFSALTYVFITHSHMDHCYAHDFILRGYKYAYLNGDKLSVYGNEEVCNVFSECTAREMKPSVSPHVAVNLLRPYQTVRAGEYTVTALPAIHSKTEEALLFLIEKDGVSYFHCYDTGDLSDEAIDFLRNNGKKITFAALDCTFLDAPHKDGARHMCVEDNLNLIKRLKKAGVADESSRFAITHLSHNSNPTRERLSAIEKEYGFIAAYDGFSVTL